MAKTIKVGEDITLIIRTDSGQRAVIGKVIQVVDDVMTAEVKVGDEKLIFKVGSDAQLCSIKV